MLNSIQIIQTRRIDAIKIGANNSPPLPQETGSIPDREITSSIWNFQAYLSLLGFFRRRKANCTSIHCHVSLFILFLGVYPWAELYIDPSTFVATLCWLNRNKTNSISNNVSRVSEVQSRRHRFTQCVYGIGVSIVVQATR